MTSQHFANCVLRDRCRKADTDACTRTCPSYIAVHGMLGRSGLSGAANIPPDYRLITIKSEVFREIRRDQPVVNEIIDAYIATFARVFEQDEESIKSLYLFSRNPGTGKTTTAAAILNEFIAQVYIGSLRHGVTLPDRPAYFLDVNAWQTLYNEFNRPYVPEDIAESAANRYYSVMAAAKTAKLAVLDDIGVRGATEAFRADLHDVINARVTSGLPTIYTSNIPMSDLRNVFDDRLADRIRDRCVEIAFVGESKRGLR